MHRSCEYTNLCFDAQRSDYVLIVGHDATTAPPSVALGGVNPRWTVGRGFDRGAEKVRWSPGAVVVDEAGADDVVHYELPDDVFLLPFHSMAGHNVGHLLWDDLLPLYSLLDMFGYNANTDRRRLLPIRHVLNATLYANCDIRRNKRLGCRANFEKFLPLLGVDPATFSTSSAFDLKLNEPFKDSQRRVLICATGGAAGTGLLTDHGLRDHGWDAPPPTAEPVVPHNLGRARQFYGFRSFLLRNALVAPADRTATRRPRRITFSLRSSRDRARRLNFTEQIASLDAVYRDDATVAIRSYDFRELSLREQVQKAVSTDVFVTACGGGSMTATFLPRGAALIVFYSDRAGLDFASMRPNDRPTRLDWDLLNHAASHLTVHWLPVSSMAQDLQLFVALVRHEVAIRQRGGF